MASATVAMPRVPMVFARSLRKIVRGAGPQERGRRLLKEMGLEPETIENPARRVPYTDMMVLAERAARMTKDGAFGLHVGERVEQREYGLVGYCVMTSATLGDALRTLERYVRIWTDVGTFALEVDGPTAIVRWDYAKRALPETRQDCEMTMATLARFNLLSAEGEWRPREVWFQHAKPKDAREHGRIFRAPVKFGMPMNALLIDRRLLEIPLLNADPCVHAALTAAAEGVLARGLDDGSFAARVSRVVRDRLGNERLGLEAASRELGVGKRTLERRLKREGSSYRLVVEQARRELARYLLLGTCATPTETATALGYADPSVFNRAFRKWYGAPPQAYRGSRVQ